MTLDEVRLMTRRPTTLNALHACDPSHPWHQTTIKPWYNAYCAAVQDPAIDGNARLWLRQQAINAKEIRA